MFQDSRFSYHPLSLLPPRLIREQEVDGVTSRLMVLTMPDSTRRVVELLKPQGEGPFAAILYAHWYEPQSPDSNRRQFHEEALRMAQNGAVCLLVETMWSDLDWFYKRTQADDEGNTIRQVIEFRVASDLLLAQYGVDPERFAFVGHDFGAMYGVLLGRVDQRPKAYVLAASAPRLADWYLYYPQLEGEEAAAYREKMQPYDPIIHLHALEPASLLFQFGTQDQHVSVDQAQEQFDAANAPKEVVWYDAGHGLNEKAREDRIEWLLTTLKLTPQS